MMPSDNTKNTKPTRKPAGSKSRRTLISPAIEILGIDESGAVLLWSNDTRRVIRLNRLRDLDRPSYAIIGGPWVKTNVQRKDMDDVQVEIGLRARDKPITNSRVRDQGIWPHGNGILVVSGNQAAVLHRPDIRNQGTIVRIPTPLHDGHILMLDDAKQWCDPTALINRAASISVHEACAIYEQVSAIVSRWKFEDARDREVVTSLVFATVIQAVFGFRPHVWLTGQTNTGKTALEDTLHRLFPWSGKYGNETTEAALRQAIGHTCLPVYLDEFECWPGRTDVIKLLRGSTRGAELIKGTPAGTPMHFGLNHMVWVASIETGQLRAADRNRFIFIRLGTPEVLTLPPDKQLNALGLEVTAVSLAVGAGARLLAAELGRLEIDGHRGRLVEAYAVPAAVYAAIHGLTAEDATKHLEDVLRGRAELEVHQEESDERQLLEDIMAAKIHTADNNDLTSTGYIPYRDLTVSQMIQDGTCGRDLEANGIRMLDEATIFINDRQVRQGLLKTTHWARLNIRDILLRLPGACASRRWLAGRNIRGIVVPIDDDDPAVPEEE